MEIRTVMSLHVFAREESVNLGRAALEMLGEKIRGTACAALHEEMATERQQVTKVDHF